MIVLLLFNIKEFVNSLSQIVSTLVLWKNKCCVDLYAFITYNHAFTMFCNFTIILQYKNTKIVLRVAVWEINVVASYKNIYTGGLCYYDSKGSFYLDLV